MKKLAALAFMLVATARAGIIDVTPGGFTDPDVINHLVLQELRPSNPLLFFDSITPTGGWVSQFGALDGGTYFTSTVPTDTADISWNMAGSGFCCLEYVLLESFTGLRNLYLISDPDDRAGSTTITIDGHTGIDSIAFYGLEKPVIDETFTLALFGIALACLFCAKYYERIQSL